MYLVLRTQTQGMTFLHKVHLYTSKYGTYCDEAIPNKGGVGFICFEEVYFYGTKVSQEFLYTGYCYS